MRERMGSGGPRGLQIPRSDASCVRGGFDSHTFPPILLGAALAAALMLAAPAARAATAADSARAGWSEQPRFVMARSLLVPGWGQAHNGAWWKAAVVAGTEGLLGVQVLRDHRELRRLDDRLAALEAAGDSPGYAATVNEYNARLDAAVGRQWLLAGTITLSLIDAYVDAHFRGFGIEFQNDPALPEGLPPDPGPMSGRGGSAARGSRLALRWTF